MVGDGEEPELCLRLGIGEVRPISGDADSAKVCRDERCFERKEKCQEKQKLQQQQQNKKITIFYKGQICACDVTEIQARAIISMANQAIGNSTATKNGEHTSMDTNNNHHKENSRNTSPGPMSRTPHSISVRGSNMNRPPPQLVSSGLTMKRSLQRFLQKRKARLAATAAAPYDARIKELLSSSIS